MKDKMIIAIFFGGTSSEYSVSLESAYAVIKNLDRKKYVPVPVGISREGRWFVFTGDERKICSNQWQEDSGCIPAVLSPDRSMGGLLLFHENKMERLPIDAAFPVMHGRFGEDGTLQGLIELAGIPLVGCSCLSSALCMDKERAHRLAQLGGVEIPHSQIIEADYAPHFAADLGQAMGYPLFVKPVRAGSSYGVTKVLNDSQLLPAIKLAFRYDSRVIVEECIDGFEVGCAVMGNRRLTVGEIDEIELSGGFFDFTEKYTLKTSSIHVPARIAPDTALQIKETAKTLYRLLDCCGFARIDMFLTPKGRIVFNEINTIPGFTEHSRFPGMMKAAGISFPQLLDTVIGLAVERST